MKNIENSMPNPADQPREHPIQDEKDVDQLLESLDKADAERRQKAAKAREAEMHTEIDLAFQEIKSEDQLLAEQRAAEEKRAAEAREAEIQSEIAGLTESIEDVVKKHDEEEQIAAERAKRSSDLIEALDLDGEVEKFQQEQRNLAKTNIHELASRSAVRAATEALSTRLATLMGRDSDPATKGAELVETVVAIVRKDAHAPSLRAEFDPKLLAETDEMRATIERSRRDSAKMVDTVIRDVARKAVITGLQQEIDASNLDWKKQRLGQVKAAVEAMEASEPEEEETPEAEPAPETTTKKKPSMLDRLKGMFGK